MINSQEAVLLRVIAGEIERGNSTGSTAGLATETTAAGTRTSIGTPTDVPAASAFVPGSVIAVLKGILETLQVSPSGGDATEATLAEVRDRIKNFGTSLYAYSAGSSQYILAPTLRLSVGTGNYEIKFVDVLTNADVTISSISNLSQVTLPSVNGISSILSSNAYKSGGVDVSWRLDTLSSDIRYLKLLSMVGALVTSYQNPAQTLHGQVETVGLSETEAVTVNASTYYTLDEKLRVMYDQRYEQSLDFTIVDTTSAPPSTITYYFYSKTKFKSGRTSTLLNDYDIKRVDVLDNAIQSILWAEDRYNFNQPSSGYDTLNYV
jgi:hypothetical protein